MKFIEEKNRLRIKIDEDDKAVLQELEQFGLQTIAAEHEFFERFLCNSEYEWIRPEEIGALTSAPILGIKDMNDRVVICWAYMDYQVLSMLKELLKYGEVVLQEG
jgi:hypothetical protein